MFLRRGVSPWQRVVAAGLPLGTSYLTAAEMESGQWRSWYLPVGRQVCTGIVRTAFPNTYPPTNPYTYPGTRIPNYTSAEHACPAAISLGIWTHPNLDYWSREPGRRTRGRGGNPFVYYTIPSPQNTRPPPDQGTPVLLHPNLRYCTPGRVCDDGDIDRPQLLCTIGAPRQPRTTNTWPRTRPRRKRLGRGGGAYS